MINAGALALLVLALAALFLAQRNPAPRLDRQPASAPPVPPPY